MKFFAALALASSALIATSAQADEPIDATSPEALVSLITSLGHTFNELEKDSFGDPIIHAETNGLKWSIYFYDCTDGQDCGSIQFYTGYDLEKGMSLKEINNWNAENRFVRAYLDDDNDPLFEMDVNLRHGVTHDNLVNTVNLWSWSLSRTDIFTD